MVGQGPFEAEFDALSAAGARSNAAGSGDYHPAFFAQTTTEWGVYKDSDIPKIPDTFLDILVTFVTVFTLFTTVIVWAAKGVLWIGDKISGDIVANVCSPAGGGYVWWNSVVCWLATTARNIADIPYAAEILLVVNTGLLIHKIYQYNHPKREVIKYTRRKRPTEVRYIWAGSGQAQFGCGTRGISITNSNKFNYLLWWDKIEFIYFESDRRNLGFQKFWPWGEEEKPVEVNENTSFFFPPARHYSNARPKGAVRIRLVPGYANQSFVEEIIIPGRFFGTSRESASGKKFVRCCWEFKWRQAHVWPMRYKSTQT